MTYEEISLSRQVKPQQKSKQIMPLMDDFLSIVHFRLKEGQTRSSEHNVNLSLLLI